MHPCYMEYLTRSFPSVKAMTSKGLEKLSQIRGDQGDVTTKCVIGWVAPGTAECHYKS